MAWTSTLLCPSHSALLASISLSLAPLPTVPHQASMALRRSPFVLLNAADSVASVEQLFRLAFQILARWVSRSIFSFMLALSASDGPQAKAKRRDVARMGIT